MRFSARRVVVLETSVAGRSSFGARLARLLGVTYVDIRTDRLRHDGNPADFESVRNAITAHTAAPGLAPGGWVVAGDHAAVRDLVWSRAEALVWLDYRRHIVMWHMARRMMWRVLLRQRGDGPVPNGLGRPGSGEQAARLRYAELLDDPQFEHLRVIRLRSPRHGRRYLTLVSGWDHV